MPPKKKIQEEKMADLSLSDLTWIDSAFPPSSQQPLNKSVRDALAKDPKNFTLLHDIGKYILTLRPASPEPSTKKRKVSNDVSADEAEPVGPAPLKSGKEILLVKEISFSVPQRKKFSLLLTTGGMSAVSAVSGETEFGVSWDSIKYMTCLPVPDKAARQWNFCIFPEGAEGIGDGNGDAIVFTIPDGAPKTATGDGMGAGYDTTSYKSLLVDTFNALLKTSKPHVSVQEPSEVTFHSALPQSHRKGEKAFHVKAHRGSKEGYLFFLKSGILWAFKKPLAYFSFTTLSSISYTSITKRTFNLSIHVSSERGGAEIEFAMIDQEDYPGIDTYIKRNRLNDASMAEARRAKQFKVNGEDGEEEGGHLEQAMVDLEDEEEEDYVPGQDEDGDGEGGGSESEDSEEEGSEDMGSEDEGSVDLEDELGSEMEDVDMEQPREKRNKK